MPRIILIHGFATGVRFSVFRPPHGIEAGLTGFRREIKSGEAKAFRWDIKEEAYFLRSLNPLYTLDIYRRERAIAKSTDTYRNLAKFLADERPEVIVCHSMGCFLFSEYLKRENLPESVKHIIYNQADLPWSGSGFSKEIIERVRAGKLFITNTFCFWDSTLWSAVFTGGSIRAGLFGMRSPWVRNRFFALLRPFNIHTAAIRSPRFRDLVLRMSRDIV
jgi:hypothetical protein